MSARKYIVNAMGMHSLKYGGLERFMVVLARELNKHNIGLIIIYNSNPSSEYFIRELDERGVKLVISHAMRPFAYFLTFLKLFIRYRPVIVHAHFQNYFTIVFAWLLGCKKIYTTIHGMAVDKDSNYIYDAKSLPLSTRFYRRIIYSMVSRIFVVSEALRKQYTMLFPWIESVTETLYLGSHSNNHRPDLSRKKLAIDPGRVIIGTIGFNSPIKGLDVLMDAMVILLKDYHCTNYILCQIGIDINDPENINYLNECSKKGLDKYIQWMGIREDVAELLPGMDIYCQPSRSEALPLSIMEAGMAGLPIIGSNVGGIPEIVLHNHTGFLIDSEDSKQLAAFLYKMISNVGLRKEMGIKSKELVLKYFSIHTQAGEICKKYLQP